MRTQAGRLIRLFGGAIDAMVRAREHERAPFDVLDVKVRGKWAYLYQALGKLANTIDFSLSARRSPTWYRSKSSTGSSPHARGTLGIKCFITRLSDSSPHARGTPFITTICC